jgi:hypothetical protein
MPYEDRKARGAIVMLTATAALASFTHYFGFLLATAAFLTCFILTNRLRRAIVVLAGSGVVASFVPWVVYHSQFISGDRAAWIGKFPVVASINWFEYLSFGGTASFVLFIGTATALVAMGGWRRLVAGNSTISACTLLCLLTLTVAGRDLAPHADPDRPQHDRHSSGSVLDRGGTYLVLDEAQ